MKAKSYSKMKTKILTPMLVLTVGLTALSNRAATPYTDGELILGFTAEIGNDFEYNLGAATAITNGQSWNLSTQLASFDLTTVKWGVVGSDGTTDTAWCTKATSLPPTLTATRWNNQDLSIRSIYALFLNPGAGQSATPAFTLANSWDQQTEAGTLSTSYKKRYIDPNVIGSTANNFYRSDVDSGGTPILQGTFTLAPNGVVTFATNSIAALVPPPKIVLLTRTSTSSTIYFSTTNNAALTYRLYYTNASGLTAPLSNWTVSATSVVGNGLTNSITDTSADPNRFYRVGVH